MAYTIVKEDCVNCAACEGECPTDAISEKDDARIIDADLCIDCGACCDVCPTECINA